VNVSVRVRAVSAPAPAASASAVSAQSSRALTAEPRPAANPEAALHASVLLPVLDRRPHEEPEHERARGDDDDGKEDLGRGLHAIMVPEIANPKNGVGPGREAAICER
jgi:hypothetical protein